MPTAAVIGASNDRSKFGNKAVRAFVRAGFTVYPVNPQATHIEGLTAYPDISRVPGRPDRVSVYVRPEVLLQLLPGIAAKGCGELWLNPGTASETVRAEARRLGLRTVEACGIEALGISPDTL